MKRPPLFLIALWLLSLPYGAAAQEAMPLSLEESVRYAMEHKDEIRNARLDVAIQEARNAQVTANALPRINGKGEFDYFAKPTQSLLPGEFFGGAPGTFYPIVFTPKFVANASVSGSQLLFDGPVLVALKARNTVMELATQASRLTAESLRFNVQRAYYSVVITRKQADILYSTMTYVRDLARDVNIMYQNGLVEKIDVNRAQVQITNLQTDSIRIAGLVTTTEQLLKYQIGMDIDQPIVLTDTSLNHFWADASALSGEDFDYNNRTEYQLLQTQLKLNEYDLKRYRLSALPSLAAFANAGYNYGANEFGELTKFRKNYLFSTVIGLQLNVPIFNGFLRKNQVREARLNIEKTQNNIHALELGLDFQQTSAKTTLVSTLRSLESQQRNMELANTVLDLARRKYKEGVGSNLEVNTAQTDLLQSQSRYFNAMLDVVNAQADLQRALGQFK